MHIAAPPRAGTFTEGNLSKQEHIFALCFDPLYDVKLPSAEAMPLMSLAHEPEYLDQMMTLGRVNGFGNVSVAVLRHAVQSLNTMYSASECALKTEPHVAFAPCSGFHHAGYNYSGGYCTFNGLVIAAANLREAGLVNQVTIIDGDGHFGDGTQDIIDKLELTWLRHVPLDYHTVRGSAAKAEADLIEGLSHHTDLVLYQAGADAHKADPYQAGYLSDEEWRERDLLLFNTCKQKGYPVAWNLAGGYNGVKTLTLHTQTFAAALQVYEPGSPRIDTSYGTD